MYFTMSYVEACFVSFHIRGNTEFQLMIQAENALKGHQ
jgi:hypothetical protein